MFIISQDKDYILNIANVVAIYIEKGKIYADATNTTVFILGKYEEDRIQEEFDNLINVISTMPKGVGRIYQMPK